MRYICRICGYIYDEAKEKVPFHELPDSWRCPLCGAAKSEFKAEEEAAPAAKAAPAVPHADPEKLTPGQLAAVCSNLARGCEKQYRPEEAGLFRTLADHFAAQVPPAEDATAERVSALLLQDTGNYPGIRAAVDGYGDRGAARICVWGEKVTRMLSSLVERYLQEGEAMLEGKDVWVCTVCGFVYIGTEAPALCPVCKVPSWKFEKTEGRQA